MVGERIKAIIVALPALLSIGLLITAYGEKDGQYAIASAIFFLSFVLFVKVAYGRS